MDTRCSDTTWGLLSITAVCLVVGTIAAAEPNQRLYRSAHYLGRGDTGIAIADNQEAIFYNPAGLAYGKNIYKKTVLLAPMLEISKGTKDLIRETAVEENEMGFSSLKEQVGKPQHFGLSNLSAVVLRRAALGVFFASEANFLVYKAKDEGALEVVDANFIANAGLTFSVAESFFKDFLLLGATAKYLRRGVAEANVSILDATNLDRLSDDEFVEYGSGMGVDIGLMLRQEKAKLPWAFGLTIENIGDTRISPEEKDIAGADNLKQTVNLGFSVQPGSSLSRLKLLLDLRDITSRLETNTFKKLYMGAELSIKDMLGISTGLHQGYPSAGFYLDGILARLDVGAYTEETGAHVGRRPDPRYYARLALGF